MENIQEILQPLEEKIQKHFSSGKSPGMALGVVLKDKRVYSRGFEYRDLENKLLVTEDSIFDIGSVTKTFTAAAIAKLVEEKKLSWLNPIINFMPDFKVNHDYATNHLTLVDFLSHRTGLARHEFSWFFENELSYQKIMDKLPHLEFYIEPREYHIYNNIMYYVLAKLISDTSKTAFTEFLHKYLFDPLDMSSTTFDNEILNDPQMAKPYRINDEQLELTEYYNLDIFSPGGIKSTLNDLSKWISLILNKGKVKDKQLLKEKTVNYMLRPHIFGGMGIDWIKPDSKDSMAKSYGLGWFHEIYRGKQLNHHTGHLHGFSSMIAILPDEELGIICLINEQSNYLSYPVVLEIVNRILFEDDFDYWQKMIDQLETDNENKDEKEKIENNSEIDLELYTGVYTKKGYPDLSIFVEDNILTLGVNDQNFRLEFKQDNKYTFSIPILYLNSEIEFCIDQNCTEKGLKAKVDHLLKPLWFDRI
ncbi:MAG: beta-lactamase family protein [Candidatus Heimdallarchaeota archaeon]|nr:beta-lactamase family protein [Candidatus Heimdallarchaeota archaeon]